MTAKTDTKSSVAFLDQLLADPLNPDLCRQFGVEIVPAITTGFPCGCPPRLHCTSDTPHPACEVCDDCHSGMPATCITDNDYEFRASDGDTLPPWILARMGY